MINHFFMLCKLLFKIILLGKTMRITIWINTLNVFLPYYSTLLIWIFDKIYLHICLDMVKRIFFYRLIGIVKETIVRYCFRLIVIFDLVHFKSA
jgi:hypothetical protein